MTIARQVALDILDHLFRDNKTLDFWIDKAEPQISRLNRPDRALVHALVFGTVRWRSRLDFVIDQMARRPAKIDPLVRHILQMALFQMFYMERVPRSAAVHTAVDLAKKNGRNWSAGFVNGVLRRVAATPDEIDWPDPERLPHLALAIDLSFPQWLIRRWVNRFGFEETKRLCEAINRIPAMTFRTNTLKIERSDLMNRIQDDAESIWETHYSPDGIQSRSLRRPLKQWPAYSNGWFQVQDEAAQLVSHLVAPNPGDSIWDACAGLGTKSAHLAQLMGNSGRITATDRQPVKLDRLSEEMQRLGITAVAPRAMDLTDAVSKSEWTGFDKILVDAPCTGIGVLQNNPDGKWRLDEAEIGRSAMHQSILLDRASPRLRVGGTLTYAVCSFEPEENEKVIEGFLQKHPEFAIDIPEMATAPQARQLITQEGFFKAFPHKNRMSGFFAARLIRRF